MSAGLWEMVEKWWIDEKGARLRFNNEIWGTAGGGGGRLALFSLHFLLARFFWYFRWRYLRGRCGIGFSRRQAMKRSRVSSVACARLQLARKSNFKRALDFVLE